MYECNLCVFLQFFQYFFRAPFLTILEYLWLHVTSCATSWSLRHPPWKPMECTTKLELKTVLALGHGLTMRLHCSLTLQISAYRLKEEQSLCSQCIHQLSALVLKLSPASVPAMMLLPVPAPSCAMRPCATTASLTALQ